MANLQLHHGQGVSVESEGSLSKTEKPRVPLTEIYNKYDEYCKDRGIFPATKKVLGQVVRKIFSGVFIVQVKKFVKKKVSYEHFYEGLTWCRPIPVSKNATEFSSLPEYCTVSSEHDGNVIVTVPTTYVCDKEPVAFNISLQQNTITNVTVNNKEINVGNFGISLDSTEIHQLVLLLQDHDRCQGCEGEKVFESSKKSLVQKKIMGNSVTKNCSYEYHSNDCSFIVPFTAIKNTCESCSSITKYNRKRSAKTVLGDITNLCPKNHEDSTLSQAPGEDTCPDNFPSEKNSIDDSVPKMSRPTITENDSTDTITANDSNELIKQIEKIFPHSPGLKLLIESQIKNNKCGADPRGRRWSPDIIKTCLTMWLRSPKSYEDLKASGSLILPCTDTLSKYKNSIRQAPGFIKDNIMWMANEADRQGVTASGRRGGLLIDEMQIQDDIQVILIIYKLECK